MKIKRSKSRETKDGRRKRIFANYRDQVVLFEEQAQQPLSEALSERRSQKLLLWDLRSRFCSAFLYDIFSFSNCVPLWTERQPKGQAGIGANGDAMAGIGDRCQSHGIGGPSGQLKTVSCFTAAETNWKQKRLKSNCSLLVPACGSLSLSAGQQRNASLWEKQNTGFVCKLLEQSWSCFATPWSWM